MRVALANDEFILGGPWRILCEIAASKGCGGRGSQKYRRACDAVAESSRNDRAGNGSHGIGRTVLDDCRASLNPGEYLSMNMNRG